MSFKNEISLRTIGHYEAHARSYSEGTWDHDVSQNITAFLDNMYGQVPFEILDLGCGPGRDLKVFSDLGHQAIGLDGAPSFVEMAREFSGCQVWHQDFMALELPKSTFDGIFANAVLFHVPRDTLPQVLSDLHTSLKQDGVLFTSNPRGKNEEGWYGERYGSYCDLQYWQRVMSETCFNEITHYYRPEGLPRVQQPWLASVWRKT